MLEFDLRKPAHHAAWTNHKRATASRREVTAGSGLLGVCALIGTAVQTQASPVAMGIASGDPALRPGGVAFLFPGPASGFLLLLGGRRRDRIQGSERSEKCCHKA